MTHIATFNDYKNAHSISVRNGKQLTSVSISHGLFHLYGVMGKTEESLRKQVKKYFLQYEDKFSLQQVNTGTSSYRDRARQLKEERSHFVEESITMELLGIVQEIVPPKTVDVYLRPVGGETKLTDYTLPGSVITALNRIGMDETVFLSYFAAGHYRRTNGSMKQFSAHATQAAYMLVAQEEQKKRALAA